MAYTYTKKDTKFTKLNNAYTLCVHYVIPMRYEQVSTSTRDMCFRSSSLPIVITQRKLTNALMAFLCATSIES